MITHPVLKGKDSVAFYSPSVIRVAAAADFYDTSAGLGEGGLSGFTIWKVIKYSG